MVNPSQKQQTIDEPVVTRIGLRRKTTSPSYYSLLNSPKIDYDYKPTVKNPINKIANNKSTILRALIKKEPAVEKSNEVVLDPTVVPMEENNLVDSNPQSTNDSVFNLNHNGATTPETYLIDRYKYAVRHIKQGLSVEEACNKYRISKGALLKCLSGGTAPRGKKTRLTESEENEIVEWLINYKDLKYNDAIHLVFEQVAHKFEQAQRPNPFNNGKPSMDWWYDFLSRHPQIMASKPDWIMRGKVNDQYIKDVQSGQLKCTKFRRALLSAIQYIRSLNESINSSLSEPTSSVLKQTDVSISKNKNTTSSSLKKISSLKENSEKKIYKTTTRLNNKIRIEKLKEENHGLVLNVQSNNIKDKKKESLEKKSNFNRRKNSGSVRIQNKKSKGKSCYSNENQINVESLTDEEHDGLSDEQEESDEEEEIEENLNNDANVDNVTFITEIFDSELESHNFDSLIDPNFLLDNNDQNKMDNFGEANQNSYLNNSPIYDINTSHQSSPDYMLNNDFTLNNSEEKETLKGSSRPRTSLLFNNQLLNTSSLSPSYESQNTNYNQLFAHHRQHQHLFVPDDDENE